MVVAVEHVRPALPLPGIGVITGNDEPALVRRARELDSVAGTGRVPFPPVDLELRGQIGRLGPGEAVVVAVRQEYMVVVAFSQPVKRDTNRVDLRASYAIQ